MERIDRILAHPLFVSHLEKNRQAEEGRKFCRHDLQHFLDVARIGQICSLEEGQGLDRELVYAAALLHDRLPSEKGAQDALLDYFTLAVYRVIVNAMGTGAVGDLKSVFTPSAADALSAAALDSLLHIRLCPAESGVNPASGVPFSLQAVVTRAESLLQREFAAMLHPKEDA